MSTTRVTVVVVAGLVVMAVVAAAAVNPRSARASAGSAWSTAPVAKVWVTSDLTDPAHAVTDPDDIVTSSAFLLLSDAVRIKGWVVGATPFTPCIDAARWANGNLKAAYAAEVANLLAVFPAYAPSVRFQQASTCGSTFNPATTYDVTTLPTVQHAVRAIQAGPIAWLNWSPMTEMAVAVQYLLAHDPVALARSTFVTHWTRPVGSYNCATDGSACNYLHHLAASGTIHLYELGPAGQSGLVADSCGDGSSLSQATMSASAIGAFMSVKWTGVGMPDLSDGATYLALLGYGGGLTSLHPDGRNDPAFRDRLCRDRPLIFARLEARATAAAGG